MTLVPGSTSRRSQGEGARALQRAGMYLGVTFFFRQQ